MSKNENIIHAAWIWRVLQEHDLTQRALAQLLGAEESKVSLAKRGRRALRASEWRALADYAGVSYDDYWKGAPS